MLGGGSPSNDEGKPPESTQPAKPDAEIARLQRELEAKDARINELSESERFWAERAKGGKPAADGEEPEAPEVEEDPDKFAEDLAADGVKALHKRGILGEKQIRELIRTEGAKVAGEILARREQVLTREGELLNKYPDLRDEHSEFFKETAKVLREEFGDAPEFQRTPKALKIAADLVAARRPRRSDADDDLSLRLRSQSGRSAPRSMDDDDGLGSQEREIIRMMGRYGVTEKGFKEQQQAIRRGRR